MRDRFLGLRAKLSGLLGLIRTRRFNEQDLDASARARAMRFLEGLTLNL